MLIKHHNKNLLLYHLVFPVKYREQIFGNNDIAETFKNICLQISERYEIYFVEIGIDKDNVHLLIRSVPKLPITKIVTTLKSIIAKQLFLQHPEIKKELWGGNFWTSGYYVNTVGQYGTLPIISNYVKNQEQEYSQLHQLDYRPESSLEHLPCGMMVAWNRRNFSFVRRIETVCPEMEWPPDICLERKTTVDC